MAGLPSSAIQTQEFGHPSNKNPLPLYPLVSPRSPSGFCQSTPRYPGPPAPPPPRPPRLTPPPGSPPPPPAPLFPGLPPSISCRPSSPPEHTTNTGTAKLHILPRIPWSSVVFSSPPIRQIGSQCVLHLSMSLFGPDSYWGGSDDFHARGDILKNEWFHQTIRQIDSRGVFPET